MFLLFRRFSWNLFFLIFALLVAVVLVLFFRLTHEARQARLEQIEEQLSRLILLWQPQVEPLFSEASPELRQEACRRFKSATACRATLIAADGTVLADSDEDPEMMDNHAAYPEVAQAREREVGTAIRYSPTVRCTMMYQARRLMPREALLGYVRVAYPLAEVENAFSTFRRSAMWLMCWILLPATAIALLLSRQVTHPLHEIANTAEAVAQGDLDRRMPHHYVGELHRVATALNSMIARLQLAIQDSKQQAAQLTAMLESMAEGVIATDEEQRVVNMNAAAAGLLGLPNPPPPGTLLGEVVRQIEILDVVRQTLSQRAEIRKETLIRDANDNEHYVEIRGRPGAAHGQRHFGCVLVLHDATRLWQLERIRRDFVANVSHELKTPITSIKGAAETLLDSAANDPAARVRFLQIIARHADRLNAIITDLLLLSRVEQEGEKLPIVRQFIPIGALLQEAVQVCQARASAKNIAIDTSCPPALTARVVPDLLEQAVINLLDNAIKYSDSGRSIRLSAKAFESRLEIRVEDQGCGIPAEHLPRIFERFYRVDKARSRAVGGTGLGLAIVKHIVQLHHGTVGVESKVGQGSTFIINIPLEGETNRSTA